MKFAVVEYSSKSGKIWRATPDSPNYLEDPQRVIDPTSFGCYVTALEGEHIPITQLANRHFYSRFFKRIRGHWPNYPLDYFSRFDALLLVHQISDAHEIARLACRLRLAHPHLVLVGVPTQPYGLLRSHLASDKDARRHFIQFLHCCHVFVSVVKATLPWYQTLTRTPVVYLPQIYPAHFATRFAQPRPNKDQTILVAGVPQRPHVGRGFFLARALQRACPQLLIHVTQVPGVPLNIKPLAGTRYEVVPFQPWREHLPYLARQLLVINTDFTFTRGRVQVDCAAISTPSLGANSDGQVDLFPELAATPATPLKTLIAQAQRLITDTAYYQRTVDLAHNRLKKYDYPESAARLASLINSYRQL